MFSVIEYLDKAAEHDREANEATRPSQKKNSASMAKAYRYLARQRAKIDELPTSVD